jgi:Fe-S-cluster containining protein
VHDAASGAGLSGRLVIPEDVPLEMGGHDSLGFDCTGCGECCRGDIQIVLNLNDLRRMADYLGLVRTQALWDGGWVKPSFLDAGGYRPMIVFRKQPFPFCPFLENRLEDSGTLSGDCKLHHGFKPLVCRLAPLGREWSGSDGERWFAVLPIKGCPGGERPLACPLTSCVRPLREELDWEAVYFSLLERLQAQGAGLELYQSLYGDWEQGLSFEDYLRAWSDQHL